VGIETRTAREIIKHFLGVSGSFPLLPPRVKFLHNVPVGDYGKAISDMEMVEEEVREIMHRAQRKFPFERTGP